MGFTAPLCCQNGENSQNSLFQPVAKIFARSVFCCTFRSLTAPSLSLAFFPAKSRLSSGHESQRLPTFPLKLLRRDVGVFLLQRRFLRVLLILASSGCASSVRRKRGYLPCGRYFRVVRLMRYDIRYTLDFR